MNYEQIVKQAQDSYNRFFKQVEELPSEKDMTDVKLDVKKINKVIEEAKAQAEGHMTNLNKIREELETKAANAEEKTFPKEHRETTATVNKMYNEYLEAQKRLFALSSKVAKINHDVK